MILLSLLNFSLYTHVEVDEDGVVHLFHIREKMFMKVHTIILLLHIMKIKNENHITVVRSQDVRPR